MRHSFNTTPKEAIELQKKLREEIQLVSLSQQVKYIAGADVSFNKFERDVYAGIIVLTYPELEPVEHVCVREEVDFPYIPGLLSFREIPPLLLAWDRLQIKPDVVVVDGHGIAHPRRMGIATHFGLVTEIPTIGCAKSKLYGTYGEPGAEAGSFSHIIDPKTGEVIGMALRSKKRSKPILVSPGNLITLEESVEIIKHTLRGYRLPEPTRLAHNMVNEYRKIKKRSFN